MLSRRRPPAHGARPVQVSIAYKTHIQQDRARVSPSPEGTSHASGLLLCTDPASTHAMANPITPPAPTLAELAELAQRLAVHRQDWIEHVRLRSDERWFERIEQSPDHDVWVIELAAGPDDRVPRPWRVLRSIRGRAGHSRRAPGGYRPGDRRLRAGPHVRTTVRARRPECIDRARHQYSCLLASVDRNEQVPAGRRWSRCARA